MKKSIYFLWIVLTAVIGGIWFSACSNDDPEAEPEIVPGYIFDIQISPLAESKPFMATYDCAGLLYEGELEHNVSSFTFKADPTKNVRLNSIGIPYGWIYPECVDFSDIKNGAHTFECGAKLTMISDTEFKVTDLPKYSNTDNQSDTIYIHMFMTPSQYFVSKDSEIVETKDYYGEGEYPWPINVRLFHSYDLSK